MSDPGYVIQIKQNGTPHEIKLSGGPLESPEKHAALFAALGHAAASWARLEQHLDALLIHVNKDSQPELYNPTHPVSIASKIKLLKRWFNQHPNLSHLADDMRQLTSNLKRLSEHRNLYLHSIVEHWDEAAKAVTFHNMKYEGDDTFRLRQVTVPLSALEAFARLANSSNAYLGLISRQVFASSASQRS